VQAKIHTTPRALYLSIDQGGHGTRAMVFTATGEAVAGACRAVATRFPRADFVEQDALQLRASLQQVVAEVVRQLGPARRHLAAAGLATQRSNVVCWDAAGRPLSPVISWQDRRAHAWLAAFEGQAARIQALTGLRLSAHYGASKLRWCLDHLPAVARHAAHGDLHYGPLASFLAQGLCQERPLLCDPANASRTLLWNLATGQWEPELLTLFGVPRQPLPRCVPSEYGFGHLPVADLRIPLRVVTGDQAAALYAYGEPDPRAVNINMGTGAFVQKASGSRLLHAPPLLSGIVHHDGRSPHYVLEGTVNGAGSALQHMARQLGLAEDQVQARLEPWWAECEAVPLFLNGVSGLGSPFWVAQFASRFVGEGDAAANMVAVAESILFLIQANLDELARALPGSERLLLSGGLAANDGLCQGLVDLSGLPAYRPAQAEATAQGLAYLLAGRPRDWGQPAMAEFVPRDNPALLARYRRWRRLLAEALKGEQGGHR
jgi:glycerol kinase